MTPSVRDQAIEDIAARIFRESHVSSRPGQCESLEEIARDLRALAGTLAGPSDEAVGSAIRAWRGLTINQRDRWERYPWPEAAFIAAHVRSPVAPGVAAETPTADGPLTDADFDQLRADVASCRGGSSPVAEPPAPAAEPPPSSSCCNGTGLADYAAVPCPNPSCPVPAPAAVGTTPQTERASLIPEIERALFGTEDGELVHDDSDLPVGELRRLLREEWAGAAPGGTAAEPEVCTDDLFGTLDLWSADRRDSIRGREAVRAAWPELGVRLDDLAEQAPDLASVACPSSATDGADMSHNGPKTDTVRDPAARESIEGRARRDPTFAAELRAAQAYHAGLRDGFVRRSAEGGGSQ